MKFVLRNSGLGFAVQCSSSAFFSMFSLLKIHSSHLSSSQMHNVRTLWRWSGACVVSCGVTAWCHPREGSHLRVLSTSLLNLVSCVLLLCLTHHVQLGYTTGISNWACPKLTPWYWPWSHKPGPPMSMTSFNCSDQKIWNYSWFFFLALKSHIWSFNGSRQNNSLQRPACLHPQNLGMCTLKAKRA